MTETVIGLIGAGSMAATHTAAWRSIGARVLVWSPSTAQDFADEHDCEASASLEEMLASCTIVDITSPTPLHLEHVRAAIGAGRAIVCEKPLARTSDTARDLAQAAEAAELPLYPAHVVRYMRPYADARAAVASGRIGTLQAATFTREGATPVGGTWFDEDAASGGILFDFLIHDYDQARWMLGEVTRVAATQSPATADGIVPALAEAHVTLTHTTGATSSIVGRWGPADTVFRTSFSLDGDTGSIAYDSAEDAPIAAEDEPYTAQLREFAAAVAGGPPPRVSAADGVAAVRIAEAVHRSAASGNPISLV